MNTIKKKHFLFRRYGQNAQQSLLFLVRLNGYMNKACFLMLWLGSWHAFAQHIPDDNFAAAIRSNCPSCIDINDNLTVNAASIFYLDVSSKNIQDLTGIKGLCGLNIFYCLDNQISGVPTLPNSLQTFHCGNNQVSSLPTLPAGLRELYCYNNQLHGLPVLPNSLEVIWCYDNLLNNLPSLPNNLKVLWCYDNNLMTLPSLPNGLSQLYCQHNQLTSLPVLSNNLIIFWCNHNLITTLPTLPATLAELACNDNQLSALPALPSSVVVLRCQGNQITCFPQLPVDLVFLRFDVDKISCLPNQPTYTNYFNTQDQSIPAPPTCSVSVVSGPTINGSVCGGSSVLLSAQATGVGSMNVRWQRRGVAENSFKDVIDTSASYISGNVTTYSPILSKVDNGARYRAVFSVCIVEGLTSAAQVIVNTPNLQASSNSPVCIGSSIRLSASGGVSYTWNGPSFNSTMQNPTRMNATSTINITPSSVNICIGQPFNLSSNGNPSASAYSWKGPNNFSSTNQNISAIAGFSGPFGIYSLTVTIGSCTASRTSEVKNGAPLNAGIEGVVCVGGTLQLTARGISSYSWTRQASNFSSTLQNPVIPSAKLTDGGAYLVVGRNGSCTASTMVLVIVTNPSINASFTVSPNPIVSGSPLTLSAVSATGSYSWSGPSGGLGSSRTVTINPFTSSKNGTYRLTLTSGLCKGYTEKLLTTSSSTRIAGGENMEEQLIQVKVWENPTKGRLKVEVSLPDAEAVLLSWIDYQGLRLETWSSKEIKEIHHLELDVEAYKEGMYMLRVETPTRQKTVKVLRLD